jgi:hypothetical protein
MLLPSGHRHDLRVTLAQQGGATQPALAIGATTLTDPAQEE